MTGSVLADGCPGLMGNPDYGCPSPPLARGSISFLNNFTVATIIPAVATFVPIGNGNSATHPVYTLDPAPINVELTGNPTDVTAQGIATGSASNAAVRTTIAVNLSIGFTIGTGALAYGIRILRNGIPVPAGSWTGTTGGLIMTGSTVFYGVPVVAEMGDNFTTQVANLTDARDLLIVSSRTGLGITA